MHSATIVFLSSIFLLTCKQSKIALSCGHTNQMCMQLDSPGVPPSANAHQLFKGFSFVATTTVEDHKISPLTNILPIVQVKFFL